MHCKYCDDTGFIKTDTTLGTKSGSEVAFEKAHSCICVINPSINKKYRHLSGMVDTIPEDMILVGKKFQLSNMLFTGDEIKFLYMLKSFIALHFIYHRTFRILDGLELVKSSYTDTAEESIYSIEDYDLFVLLCVSKPPNKVMKELTFELVRNRSRVRKACWLYSPTEEEFKASLEYSEMLQTLMVNRNFSHFNCDTLKFNNNFPEDTVKDYREGKKKVAEDFANSFGV